MKKSFLFFMTTLALSAVCSFRISAGEVFYDPEKIVQSNTAKSVKRILPDNAARDMKLLELTGNDELTAEIIKEHSLILGSRIEMVGRQRLYSWLVDHVEVSAAMSTVFGQKYNVTPGKEFQYHGEDGEGLEVEFYRAYRDSGTTVLVGNGYVKLFLFTLSGSFINFMEYENIDDKRISAQNCMYVRVNNPLTRMVADFLFAISDIERGIMEKILSLDDTVVQALDTFINDPYLAVMLQNPDSPPPEGASLLAIDMKNAVLSAARPDDARDLAERIFEARQAAGLPVACPDPPDNQLLSQVSTH